MRPVLVDMNRTMEIAALWKKNYPKLASRIDRAVALTGGVKSQGEGVFVVEGSGNHEYIVTADPERKTSTCQCPDSSRKQICKHRLAVALVYATEVKRTRR